MKSIFALLIATVMLVGCAGESLEKKIVGSWKVDTAKTVIGDDKMPETDKKMAMAMMETVTLEIKEDKTFVMKIFLDIKGTWTLTDNKLALKLDEKDKGSFKIDTFEVDSSGSTLTAKVDDKNMPGTLVMSKSEPAK